MLVVGCIPNFLSERFVAGTGACSVQFLARFYLLSSLFLPVRCLAYVSFPCTTTSIPLI